MLREWAHSALVIAILAVCAVWTTAGADQGSAQSPSDLIALLTRPTDRQRAIDGTLTCSSLQTVARENRALADELAKRGASAGPDLGRALDSISRSGRRSQFATNADWLLYAYAKNRGAAARPRLQRMIGQRRLGFVQPGVVSALSISLGLTSYVTGYRAPTPDLCSVAEPRDGLDQLISAWESNDHARLQASLGPQAKLVLQSLLGAKGWSAIRAGLPHSGSGAVTSVGYRFVVAGRWAEPVAGFQRTEDQTVYPWNPDLETQFTTGTGAVCGVHHVKFLHTADLGSVKVPDLGSHLSPERYLVDNSDLGDLLHLITSCASTTN